LGTGVLLAASPAKAISYTFSGTSTFSCSDPGFGDTCQVTFNDFTADWDGSAWTYDVRSAAHSVTISNLTNSGSFTITTAPGSSISAGSNQNFVGFSDGADLVAFVFGSPAPNPASAPSLLPLTQIDVTTTTTGREKFDTNGFVALSPSAQAYAAPYFASVLSVIPMLAASKRIKRRVLSA
jgi:hypothetical protein